MPFVRMKLITGWARTGRMWGQQHFDVTADIVTFGKGVRREIPSMPGNFQMSVDRLLEEAGAAWEDGIRSVILFGIPERKDETGSEGMDRSCRNEDAVPDPGLELVQADLRGTAMHFPR